MRAGKLYQKLKGLKIHKSALRARSAVKSCVNDEQTSEHWPDGSVAHQLLCLMQAFERKKVLPSLKIDTFEAAKLLLPAVLPFHINVDACLHQPYAVRHFRDYTKFDLNELLVATGPAKHKQQAEKKTAVLMPH
ncbi:unnamed protein product [Vitrella brassicaformis CCMP3155]|uniref:Uncharacterized protein n=1 Tax=Vitrella brassicaformis (strain CCMP3155) TaxID=1169540 RepID=A0A0G4EVR6_VITBC|nr:unnamed protein product [Vitrella brassicaformis CCMP3155]|eukprot:CEM02399.1 unnamed protein product [Vitrella brassicaformis CCMP3155]